MMSRPLWQIIIDDEEPSPEERIIADRILAEYYSERNAQRAAEYVQRDGWSGWVLTQILHRTFTLDDLRDGYALSRAMSDIAKGVTITLPGTTQTTKPF